MGPSPYIDPLIAEKEYTQEEILLRKAFVTEYMDSRNAYRACVEIGFLEVYAADWAKRFMGEGLVRRLISEAQRNDTDTEVTPRQRNYRSWMEGHATYYGLGASHGARVAATAHLMKMEGMEAPSKLEGEFTYKGGVMVVPHLLSAQDWADKAFASQTELKETVRD